jgi:predicted alpha/beta superfamily hydrolase
MNLRRYSRLVSATSTVLGCFLCITGFASAKDANSGTASTTCEKLTALNAVRAGHLGASFEPRRLMRPQGGKWDYEIQIALPASYHNTIASYPVLWVTDGSFWFNAAVDIVNNYEWGNGVPEMIVIGIGLPPEADLGAQIRDTEMRRIHDFSPERPCEDSDTSDQCKFWRAYEDDFIKRGAPLTFGGAGDFLSFIVDQVRPTLARDYRMTGDHTLMGHSAGGAFCYYAIFARPSVFDKYMCGGGKTWRGWPAQEEQYAQTHSDLPIQIYEAISGIDLLAGGAAYSVGTLLKKRHYPSLKLYTQIFPDDNHQSVVPMMLSRGLRALWAGAPGATPDAWKLRIQAREGAK